MREPIRILSDLHLGHPGSLLRSAAMLRPLLDGAASVIFNGDTSERRATKFRPRAEDERLALRDIVSDFGAEATYVTGNHDPDIGGPHYLDLPGGVFVTHGDILYKNISPWSRELEVSRVPLSKVMAKYADADLSDLDARAAFMAEARLAIEAVAPEVKPGAWGKLLTILQEAWPPRRPVAILRVWATSHRLAHRLREQFRPDSRFILYGHTHRPGIWRRGDAAAINTGGFLTMARAQVVEISAGELRVLRVVAKGGEFRLGEEAARFSL